MSMSEWFGWNRSVSSDEIPDVFPLSITQSNFVETDVVSIYSKILTDVLERTHGLNDDQTALMWDNCVKSNASDGLITLLSEAMSCKRELFLVIDSGVLRKATKDEEVKIRADYEKQAESSTGVFVSFKNYTRSDMVKLYSGLDYCTIAALHKSMNLSKAVQFKMNDLRAGVSLADSSDVKSQAVKMAQSLRDGRDILMDGKDTVETAAPDLTAAKESSLFVVKKLSFYLGLPEAYLSGEQTGGMGTSGENDTRAIERGLKSYFFSIMKPTLEALFDVSVTYKSQDFRNISQAIEVLKVFALTDDELVSKENKTKITNQLFDLPEDAEGDAPKKQDVLPPPAASVPSPASAGSGA